VTSTDIPLVLRPPVWARAWTVVFPFFAASVLVFVIRPNEAPVWIGGAVAVALSAVLAWRQSRLAVIGTADGRLVIRGHWRDRTVHRDDIAEVLVGRITGGPNRAVQLRLRDGSAVRLDVTEVPFLGGGRLARQADEVRTWLSGRPQPFV
jgi:hypothetical protein